MALTAGQRLGPFEIVTLLGAGGMGEVYRARDTRLHRDVALKVLPDAVAADPGRLHRFEQEARAASALNHPNIITVYDIGTSSGHAFVAMEVVEGRTLREMLDGRPLGGRKPLEIASQIADGLAKAHAAGIVHRDLKPENVMVSKDGFAKILDFGLAKLAETADAAPAGDVPTRIAPTTPGTVMGTVGYMSPEQASGLPTDFRSDQFAFGAILYEMVSGRKAFSRPTAAETLTAIIREEPEPLPASHAQGSQPVQWIIERCLAKDPDERYGSTRDLARDLRRLAQVPSDVTSTAAVARPGPRRARTWVPIAVVGAIAAAFASGLVAGRRTATSEQPTFARLTFSRGFVTAARFAADVQTVLFSAAWEGQPLRTYSIRPGVPEASAIQIPDSLLLAVSTSGELAVVTDPQNQAFSWVGTLARVSAAGGVPKPLLEHVSGADWVPGGGDLAVVHQVDGHDRLEFPIGRVLYQGRGWLQHPRFAPDGRHIAFIDHTSNGDDGNVVLVDLAGTARMLSEGWATVQGLGWRPDGREIWFTAARSGIERNLYGVTPDGALRTVRTLQGTPALFDVARTGEALVTEDDYRSGTFVARAGEARTADLGWYDWSIDRALTSDGRQMLFDESGEGGGGSGAVFLRPTDGSPALRVSDGLAVGLSPDGAWALTRQTANSRFVLVPVGAGQPRALPPDDFATTPLGSFFPDGRRVAFTATPRDKITRLYVQDLVAGTAPQAISNEPLYLSRAMVSPDSRWVAARRGDLRVCLFAADGSGPRSLAGTVPGDSVAGWSADSSRVYVTKNGLPCSLDALDVATGARTHVRDLAGSDPAGVLSFGPARVTPDLQTIVFGYTRILSTLYKVTGLR